MNISNKFNKYEEYNPLVPVWCVTPGEGRCIHRFFDTSPFSPSMKYMAVLRLPYEDRLPLPGETAQVVLINLEEGTEKVAADTRGWESQLGANINWGAADNELYFNDVDTKTWDAFCVKLNPHTGEKARLGGTIYRISPDGKHIISACMKRMRRTQAGYGVIIPDGLVPRNYGLRGDDGLYITDTATGESRLLVSIKEIFERAEPKIDAEKYKDWEVYGFHCKYNPQGDRIMFSMRAYPRANDWDPYDVISVGEMHYWIITMRHDGSEMYVAVAPDEWEKGGHHTTWFPDGKRLSFNLGFDEPWVMKLTQVDYDGKNMKKILDYPLGSGHPTVHEDGRYILTDTYESEEMAFGDGTVPLRWIDITTGAEKTAARVNIKNDGFKTHVSLRVDPHPAWAPDNRHVAFNGYVNGTRRVFVADFGGLL